MPVLVNFIIDNASNNISPIDFAFHLKNEGAVVKYRSYLSEIEVALEKHNWKELRYLLRCSDDAVNSVISMDKKRLNSISVGIFPTPSIMFKHDNNTATISTSPTLSLEHFEKHLKKLNLVFLKNITKYAVNDMHIW